MAGSTNDYALNEAESGNETEMILDSSDAYTSSDEEYESSPHSSQARKRKRTANSITSTKSLSDSNLSPQIEHGRSYANSIYYMPCDESEATRLAIAHQATLLLLDGALTISRTVPRRILDIGTGCADWAIAMAERYPQSQIIATDISSTLQPINVPSNLVLQIDDARQEWTFHETFDFIHIKGLKGAFEDWERIYTESFQHLEPDGVLEVADYGSIHLSSSSSSSQSSSRSYVDIYNGACQSAAENAGRSLSMNHLKKEMFERTGFSILRSTSMEVPLGTWDLEPQNELIGKMALVVVLEGLEATCLRLLTRELGWTAAEVRDLCLKVQNEVRRPEARATVQYRFVVARKLLATDTDAVVS